jgi:F-type H+-transporting ATPase subunit b
MSLRAGLATLAMVAFFVAPTVAMAQEHGHGHGHGAQMGASCHEDAECASGVCGRYQDGEGGLCTAQCDPVAEARLEPAEGSCAWGFACAEQSGLCEPMGIGDRLVLVFGSTEFVGAMFNFVMLVAILYFAARKPLAAFLARRRKSVEEGLVEAARLRADAEKVHGQYSRRLERLDRELEKIRAEMVKAGEAERDRIVQEAESKAARMRRDAEFLISQQMKQLREDLLREASVAAVQAAGEVLREKTTPEDHSRLSQAYLERLRKVAGEDRA